MISKCCFVHHFLLFLQVKPFLDWERLDMTGLERRKLCCSVTFHIIAVTCVIWSLYVLIDRTATEIKSGQLQWPFWTKLVVVAIGFTGGLVFMYIQCKVYVHLCRKWKAFNRIIVVQDAPEGIHKIKADNQDLSCNKKAEEAAASVVVNVESNSPVMEDNDLIPDETRRNSQISHQSKCEESEAQTTRHQHAETQTALRGVSIKKVDLENDIETGGSNDMEGSSDELNVSRILEEAAGKKKAIFFTECESEAEGQDNNKSENEAKVENVEED